MPVPCERVEDLSGIHDELSHLLGEIQALQDMAQHVTQDIDSNINTLHSALSHSWLINHQYDDDTDEEEDDDDDEMIDDVVDDLNDDDTEDSEVEVEETEEDVISHENPEHLH